MDGTLGPDHDHAFTNAGKAPKVAEDLLDAFGSLKGVLEARPEQLRTVAGVGAKTAALISAIVPFVRVWNREAMSTPDRIPTNAVHTIPPKLKNCTPAPGSGSRRPAPAGYSLPYTFSWKIFLKQV